jgi:hypothetical protein
MALSRRYAVHAPADDALYGMDFSPLLSTGAAITSGQLQFWTNTPGNVVSAAGDWTIDPNVGIMVRGRSVIARIAGGVAGTDYQLRWIITDSLGNEYTRTGLLLVAQTS